MAISLRLKKLIASVNDCNTVADIGTDHGYVPISLLREGKVKKALACDVSRGSLEKAVINGYKAGVRITKNDFFMKTREAHPEAFVKDNISCPHEETDIFYRNFDGDCRQIKTEGILECRLSDGLKALTPGEADCLILSGMGGILITQILGKAPDILSATKSLILSPHRDAELVRQFVTDAGFQILREKEILDKKKTYVIMKAVNKRYDSGASAELAITGRLCV